MFDPIKGPANVYQGPAAGLGTEAGDTWHDAVRKVNDGFKNVIAWAEGVGDGGDTEARKRITDLEEGLAAVQQRGDEIDGHIKALLISVDKLLTAQAAPAVPPVETAEKPQN